MTTILLSLLHSLVASHGVSGKRMRSWVMAGSFALISLVILLVTLLLLAYAAYLSFVSLELTSLQAIALTAAAGVVLVAASFYIGWKKLFPHKPTPYDAIDIPDLVQAFMVGFLAEEMGKKSTASKSSSHHPSS